MKQTIKLTENELRNMIKGAIKKTINEVKDEHPSFVESRLHNHIKNMVREALNEISDTPKGQYMLGRLAGREDSRVLSGHPKAKRFGGNEPMSYAYERNLDQSDMGYDEEKYKELRDAFDDGYVEEFNKGANDDKDGEYKFADIQAGRDDWGIYY